MNIEILDVIECKIPKALGDIVKPTLSFMAFFYQQGPYRKVRREYMKSVMSKGENCYYFPAGLLQRVLNYCKERNIKVTIIGEVERLKATAKPALKGITLREEQQRLVDKAIKDQRGVLVAPTGIGKSLLGLAVISAFPKASTLWLCHTKDLMYQAAEFAEKHLDKPKIGFIGDGVNNPQKLTFATRQSFIKHVGALGCDYDIVVIDEVHHLSGDGQYQTLMRNILAPVRIGLTATMPTDKEAILAIEGALGPIIDEVTIKEGQERGTMASIKIRFLKVPVDYKVKDLRKYQDVYRAGVVENTAQHSLIIETAAKHVKKGDSVLILVTQIAHGENLLDECERQHVQAVFAQGATEGIIRKEIKDALNSKDIHVVIATTIWNEGLNIPELNVIINAAGGKSEIRTLQIIGRGLRLTKTKRQLIMYDVMNLNHSFLLSHLGERLAIYTEMGWM